MNTAPTTAQLASDVALLVIGDELLRGDVADENTPHLARWLGARGARLARVVIVPDDVALIGEELARLVAAHQAVLTSGGVGSTHDDVTVEAVARALGVPVVVDAQLEAKIRAHYGARANEARLRMARVPAGATLVYGGFRWVPVICHTNVYVLPGVPWLFRACLENLAGRLGGPPSARAELWLAVSEGDIADELAALAAAHPAVAIGSYPRDPQPGAPAGPDAPAGPRVKLTIVGPEAPAVAAAEQALRQAFARVVLAGAPTGAP